MDSDKTSTADTRFLTRRAAEYGEQTTNKIMSLLLDWEKAFDEIDQDMMIDAIGRLNVPENY